MTGEFLKNKDTPSCYVNLVFIAFFLPYQPQNVHHKTSISVKISCILTFDNMVFIGDIKIQKLSEL